MSKDKISIWAPYAALGLFTLLCGVVLMEAESFEALYEFSRSHESWELDEFFSIALASVVGLIIMMVVRTRQLSNQMKRREALEAEANALARHDSLTGLPNRRHFVERLVDMISAAQAQKTGLAVLMIDLDRFKPINDTYGHEVGDRTLQSVADTICSELPAGAVGSRIGGDEFAVALPTGQDGQIAERIARRLCIKLAEPIDIDGRVITISASIGIAFLDDDAAGQSDLIANADMAMYFAKKNGKNTYAFFEKDHSEAQLRRTRLEGRLRSAIQNGEIVPYLQPVLDLRDNRLQGFEILARWQHPDEGVLSPDVFIPIAEDTGLIDDLADSVLRQACEAVAKWTPAVPLSFNLSPLQFKRADMVERIIEIVTTADFPLDMLEVEVTESVLIDSYEQAERAVDAFRAAGISVALDDFGKGYSSLSYLSRFNIDRIKIDKEFILGRSREPKSRKIVESVLQLGKSLHMETTAEGIESETDAAWLRNHGCTHGQGYLYAKPLSLLSAVHFYAEQPGSAEGDRKAKSG